MFYRIKQVDKSGAIYYSQIVPISISIKTKVIIQPNPASNYIAVIGTDLNRIEIVNNVGKVVMKKEGTQGRNNYLINVCMLPKGIYSVLITKLNSSTEVQKLLVQ